MKKTLPYTKNLALQLENAWAEYAEKAFYTPQKPVLTLTQWIGIRAGLEYNLSRLTKDDYFLIIDEKKYIAFSLKYC